MHCFDQDKFKFYGDTTDKIENYPNTYKYTFRPYTGDKDRFYLYMPLMYCYLSINTDISPKLMFSLSTVDGLQYGSK